MARARRSTPLRALQRGTTATGPERAATILRTALDLSGKPIEFPGRSHAIANLGLALLSTTRHDEGLALLHEAQAGYRRDADLAGLAQSRQNEIEYARAVDDRAELARLEERLAATLAE